MPDQEGNGEPGRHTGEEPGVISFIHGHSVESSVHANGVRGYLRGLDVEEAKPVFNYARLHTDAEFEIRQHNIRENFGMAFKAGKYKVRDEGKQNVSVREQR